MNRLAVLLLACAFLSGCAAKRPPVLDTVTLDKPVAVACRIELPAECRDAYAADRVSDADDMVTINRALRAELEQRHACEVKLRAAINGCNR